MEILTREKCKECDGTGIVCHRAWREFNELDDKFRKENNEAMMSSEQCETWFREKGYGTLPPEEIQCHECEGVGTVQQWIGIVKFAEIVSIHVNH